MKTISTLALVLTLVQFVSCAIEATSEKVKYRFPEFNDLDRSDPQWWNVTDRMLDINKNAKEFRGWQDDVPHLAPELKVINVTSQIYLNEIVGSKTPWILSFVKRIKSSDQYYHSEMLYQNMLILADEFQGEVRFGIFDDEDEMMKLTFDVKVMPMTFYILDDNAYQM